MMKTKYQHSSCTASAHANSPCENEMKWSEDEMKDDHVMIWSSSQIPKFLKILDWKKCFLLIKFFLKINDLRSSQRVPLPVACLPQIVYPCHLLVINPCSKCPKPHETHPKSNDLLDVSYPNLMISIVNPMILLGVSYQNLMFSNVNPMVVLLDFSKQTHDFHCKSIERDAVVTATRGRARNHDKAPG